MRGREGSQSDAKRNPTLWIIPPGKQQQQQLSVRLKLESTQSRNSGRLVYVNPFPQRQQARLAAAGTRKVVASAPPAARHLGTEEYRNIGGSAQADPAISLPRHIGREFNSTVTAISNNSISWGVASNHNKNNNTNNPAIDNYDKNDLGSEKQKSFQ